MAVFLETRNAGDGTNRQTNTQVDITTYRLNRPRGCCSKKLCFIKCYKNVKILCFKIKYFWGYYEIYDSSPNTNRKLLKYWINIFNYFFLVLDIFSIFFIFFFINSHKRYREPNVSKINYSCTLNSR